MKEKFVPSPSQLKKLAKFWQKVLRLQDWDMTIGYVRPESMQLQNVHAQNQYDLHHKQSIITVVHPKWALQENDDIEMTVVHELLHLHITPAIIRATGNADGGGSDTEEVAIHLIAEALVRLKRSIR